MNKDNNKSNTRSIIKIVGIIVYQILVIMALILTAVIVLQKLSNSNQSLAGYRVFRVITGSMEPEYEVGEVVISKQVDVNEIKVGDDIVYLGKNGEYAGKIIMHSVIEINTDENGNLFFHAKGLHSSSVEDPHISEEQIYGVVIYKSVFLTTMYNLATNIYSIFVIIIILVLNVFIAFNTPKKNQKKKIKRIKKEEELYEKQNIEEVEENKKFETIKEEIEEKQKSHRINTKTLNKETLETSKKIEELEEVEQPERSKTKIEQKELKEVEQPETSKTKIEQKEFEKNINEDKVHQQMRQYYEKTIHYKNQKEKEIPVKNENASQKNSTNNTAPKKATKANKR